MRNEPLPTNDNKKLALTVLGIGFGSTPDQVKSAYRAKAMKHHPDKGGNNKDFNTVKTAYDWLRKHGTEKVEVQAVLGWRPFVVYTTSSNVTINIKVS